MLKKQRDDGKAFMENVYYVGKEEKVDEKEGEEKTELKVRN